MNSQEQIDQAFDLIQKGNFLEARAICLLLAKSGEAIVDAQFLLGVIAFKTNNLKEAAELVQVTIEARPTVTEYYKVLGNIFLASKDNKAAISIYRQGFAVDTSNILLGMNLARALRFNGEESEARDVVHKLSSHWGGAPFAATLACWQLEYIPPSASQLATTRHNYEKAVIGLSMIKVSIEEEILLYSGTNFLAAYQGKDNRKFQELIAEFYLRSCPTLSYQAPHVDRLDESLNKRNLRIGFISMNFRNHTIGRLYQGLIAQFHRRDWDVYVYASNEKDEVSSYIQSNCYSFKQLSSSLQDTREQISADQLDVLFYADIGMDPLTYFLAFSRFAKVQCVGWGHPMTTGIRAIDYFISSTHLEADEMTHPENLELADASYTEKLVQLSLPPTYLHSFDMSCLEDEQITSVNEDQTFYFCSQTLYKIHPDFDQIIIDILQHDPNGVAIFIEGRPKWSASLQQRWQALDASAAKRIRFVPKMNRNQFLFMLAKADVILDTIYFSGGITSAEALSLGTPVVTFAGAHFMAGRVTYAYYQQIGMLDCVADTLSAYVDIAVRLGTDKNWRDRVSSRIMERQHSLFERSEVVDELSEFFHCRLASAKVDQRLNI